MRDIVKVETIYFDMDGVMADFNEGVHQLVGRPLFEEGHDDLDERIDKILEDEIVKSKLFYHLPVMEDFHVLHSIINQLTDQADVQILTAASRYHTEEAAKQKKDWLDKHDLGHIKFNYCVEAHHKAEYAHPQALLIDDRDCCTMPFFIAGGLFHLYQNPHRLADALSNRGFALSI